LVGVNAHSAAIRGTFNLYLPINEGEKGVVITHSDANTLMELGAALTDQDSACFNNLPCVSLYAEAL
jgi:hypothetical protein